MSFRLTTTGFVSFPSSMLSRCLHASCPSPPHSTPGSLWEVRARAFHCPSYSILSLPRNSSTSSSTTNNHSTPLCSPPSQVPSFLSSPRHSLNPALSPSLSSPPVSTCPGPVLVTSTPGDSTSRTSFFLRPPAARTTPRIHPPTLGVQPLPPLLL